MSDRCKNQLKKCSIRIEEEQRIVEMPGDASNQITESSREEKREPAKKAVSSYPFNSELEIAFEADEKHREILLNLPVDKLMLVRLRRMADDGPLVRLKSVSISPVRGR